MSVARASIGPVESGLWRAITTGMLTYPGISLRIVSSHHRLHEPCWSPLRQGLGFFRGGG